MQVHSKTAVLLFAESAHRQAQRKSLVEDDSQNWQLFNSFLIRKLKAVKKTGLDVHHFDEVKQRGESFGERIASAVQEVFQQGYERVIVVGGDCPDVKAKDILGVNELLRSRDLVLGPDLRGGVYLIGLHRSKFEKQRFEALAWQSEHLRSSFMHYVDTLQSAVHWLAPKADFNTAQDINNYWRLSSAIRSILMQLTTCLDQRIFERLVLNLGLSVLSIDRRGP